MARLVTVSDMRRVLYWAAGGPEGAGPGEASAALLGTVFHQIFAGLTGADARVNLVRPLEEADVDAQAWKAALRRHVYAWHVAPKLVEHAGALQEKSAEVLAFWAAAQQLAAWLAEVMWEQRRAGRTVAEARELVFEAHEQEVSRELREPGWAEAVVLQGRIDAVLRRPATGDACVVELKTGRAAPEADLCQAALYQLLYGDRNGKSAGSVAVVAFEPECRELRVEGDRLRDALAALKTLVARVAGVLPDGRTPRDRDATPPTPRHRDVTPPHAPGTTQDEMRERLVAAYAEFGVVLDVGAPALVGPAFLRFLAEPGRAVKLRDVQRLAESVWTRLKTRQPPQISVQQGRIAIDVERRDRETVPWSSLRSRLPSPQPQGTSRFPVGVAVDGSLRWADLARPENAHFLVAGTAGSGKSEWLRAALASLIASNRRDTLRLVLIDPKRIAFGAFEASAMLWLPIAYAAEEAMKRFDDLLAEMEGRFRQFADAGVQDLVALNAVAPGGPPRIVCVCDEYADLLADRRLRRDLESRVARLAAKSRAAGIHLMLATQRPSREVVQGTIDANLMARVALKVTRPMESRIVIDHPGAFTLLGQGDLLFRDLGDPVRLQSPFVTERDLHDLVSARA